MDDDWVDACRHMRSGIGGYCRWSVWLSPTGKNRTCLEKLDMRNTSHPACSAECVSVRSIEIIKEEIHG